VQVNTPGAAKGSGPKGASAKASGEFQSPQSKWRDAAGKWLSWCLRSGFSKVELRFNGLDEQEIQAVLVGIELGYYRFCISNAPIGSRPEFLTSSKIKKETLAGAQTLGQSVNWARELVNLPPADLEPESYASLCKKWFKQYPQIKVDVWDDAKLAKQGCNLHLAVGQAAPQGPRLVKISYRPEKKKSKKTFAFVGKGITFDSGGLDIKPAAGMRYMKKDMGGSAAVFGLANYVARTQPKQSYDFYLAIAENAIASNAFHPSDIITGHNGKTVEIHNTDAEGRLVLADAMSVAQKSADLDGLVDVGTLTGAMRVAVGLDIIGICSNAGKLGAAAMRAGYASGDPSWQLPLFPAYNAMLRSDFADVLNCSPGRYAGGITAALFLQHFVEDGVPWLHMDMNAYAHSPSGACLQGGGNGQGVQMLAALVDSWCEA
jgi:leucyl aminopeptidase